MLIGCWPNWSRVEHIINIVIGFCLNNVLDSNSETTGQNTNNSVIRVARMIIAQIIIL